MYCLLLAGRDCLTCNQALYSARCDGEVGSNGSYQDEGSGLAVLLEGITLGYG